MTTPTSIYDEIYIRFISSGVLHRRYKTHRPEGPFTRTCCAKTIPANAQLLSCPPDGTRKCRVCWDEI